MCFVCNLFDLFEEIDRFGTQILKRDARSNLPEESAAARQLAARIAGELRSRNSEIWCLLNLQKDSNADSMYN